MDADLKKILKAVVLEMRHELEGYYDNAGHWHPGDLETRLAEIGVRKDRASVPVDELGRLTEEDVHARKIVDAFIDVREQAGVDRANAVAEYIRESAYTWANRLVALRCMEARELLDDEVIVGREAYGGRSLVHHRLAQSSPELCTGEDDGRFAMLGQIFAERATTLPMLFDPNSPSIALRPSSAALKNCLARLSGTQKVRSQEPASDAVFSAPDALGWAYQYWNTEEKDRVFETVRTKKGAKIEGADIIPATQLYTEDYMVKFLVQNSLGATWMGMHPDSKLSEGWEYYVRDADRSPAKKKPLQQVTLLDPACGSGHFLIEAFDMFYAMYEEEGSLKDPEAICKSILENNLLGIDIDERAIQIAEASLWMKAEERAFGFSGANTNLVAATSSHLKGESWERFLTTFEKEPHIPRVLREFARSIEHIDELGSLARPFEALEEIIKAEHETWEKQERDRLEGGNFLFQELRDDLLASLLPFQDISDKEFFERTMRHALFAIDGFTKDARESGEFNDQLMGAEAKTGFRLLDLLSRRYDVVVANPPYMGSKNMGEVLKTYVASRYSPGKRDLFAAFILSCVELASQDGRVSMVTQQSWMFQKSYAKLRASEFEKSISEAKDDFQGLLKQTSLEVLVHLGPYAFSEISGEVVSSVQFIVRNATPVPSHQVTAIRLTDLQSATEKEAALRRATHELEANNRTYRQNQLALTSIDGTPLIYSLSSSFLYHLTNTRKLRAICNLRQGVATTADSRFLRQHWETADNERWRVFEKGDGYARWTTLQSYRVEWGFDGLRIKTRIDQRPDQFVWTMRMPKSDAFFKEGLTFSTVARGSLGARILRNAIFSGKSPFIAVEVGDIYAIAAFLNTRLASYFVRAISQGLEFGEGYVRQLPICIGIEDNSSLSEIGRQCFAIKRREVARSILDEEFGLFSFPSSDLHSPIIEQNMREALRFLMEACAEEIVHEIYDLPDTSVEELDASLGMHVGQYPLIENFDFISKDDCQLLPELCRKYYEKLPRIAYTANELSQLRYQVRQSYESIAKIGASIDEELPIADESVVEEEELDFGLIPVPTETNLEYLSREFKISPLSIALLINEGVTSDNWSIQANLIQIWTDAITQTVLECLGRRVLSDIDEAGDHRDIDGIIPLADVSDEVALGERVLCILRERSIDISALESLLGKSVPNWLSTEFFKHHVRQYKKRPIAWQVQSSSFTARSSPTFACVVYYHRLDVDTVPKIRTQYTGPLKLRVETEMRGISATSPSERSDRQAKRAVVLEELIVELQACDGKLVTVAQCGFGPEFLRPALRQYAFDDAILALKSKWLSKLSEFLKTQEDAICDTSGLSWISRRFGLNESLLIELHPFLPTWIGDALLNLRHHCSQVGPKAPNSKKIEVDPTSEDFVALIQVQAHEMVAKSIDLACDVWYGKFADTELQLRRERIKELKDEQKTLKEEVKRLKEQRDQGDAAQNREDEVPFTLQQKSMDGRLSNILPADRVKQLTAEIKKFEQELKMVEAAVRDIRKSITDWSSDEPLTWGEWLAAGPMFDQISSLDERRVPPKTIAEFIAQESLYAPDINDGVRVNIAPLQKAGLLAADVLAAKDVDKAIADRAEWRADERRWVREGKLPQPGWWKEKDNGGSPRVKSDESTLSVEE